ncbi:enoyl-CoA hydratase/isomerase family protein [Acidobacteria bacterium AB60]|nr:enoyl-CoA hydratase/isomerase family protein [Acidobacteria bacterium AB60]
MAELTTEIEARGPVVWVWMNRPTVHNALNEEMIRELIARFRSLAEDPSVRIIVLAGRGKSFSAGADADWMKRQGAAAPLDNLEGARELAEMFHLIAACPKPVIARVQGAAIGGGLGFACACDIAVASTTAIFATSEVRLGLIPATIGPYVVQAIGPRWARRLFLTGERIDAPRAQEIGLVHEVTAPEELDAKVAEIIENLLAGAPGAQRAAKELVHAIVARAITPELMEDTAMRIATVRSEPEAHEGLSAFLEKRPASWVTPR